MLSYNSKSYIDLIDVIKLVKSNVYVDTIIILDFLYKIFKSLKTNNILYSLYINGLNDYYLVKSYYDYLTDLIIK